MKRSTHLDKIETAMRGRDPPDGPWICRRLIYDPCEWEIEKEEAISQIKTDELDQLSLLEQSGRSIASESHLLSAPSFILLNDPADLTKRRNGESHEETSLGVYYFGRCNRSHRACFCWVKRCKEQGRVREGGGRLGREG